ncbi:MAG TPA: patatin-like phospholipase family protein [Caulobacteraceae bacterium]|nr:patatin-like phospholipase family protein [Caulobacteraceae bacterium]
MRRDQRPEFDCIALLLQGGGSLGAYQAGVYQGLAEADLHPDWVAGISIGAINSALIAGNPPGLRLERLRQFWELVTAHPLLGARRDDRDVQRPSAPPSSEPAADSARPATWIDSGAELWKRLLSVDPWSLGRAQAFAPRGDLARGLANQMSAGVVTALGAPGFFSPRKLSPWLEPAGTLEATSYYDTSAAKATLERLVDFDRINSGDMRFSVGAVNVATGNFVYFDNTTHTITPEHVMASGALPPGFPAIEIDGEFYWDGGLVSNTPLQWVLEFGPRQDTLAFQVDLWSARGSFPRTMVDVQTRQKEIQFSSRTRANSDRFKQMQRFRNTLSTLLQRLPDELRQAPEYSQLIKMAEQKVYNLVQIIYRSEAYEGGWKDHEFSRASMEKHWRSGYHDTVRTLRHPEVLQRPANDEGVFTFDLAVNGRE